MVRKFIQRSAIALFFAVALLGTATAQEGYEGLVTIGRFGRFPSGLFGASNLVPPNTMVRVRNLETGRSERVIITDSVSEPGVFLVLSPEAAESLEIDPGGATRVRLTEVSTGGAASVDPARERALSQDPDINPLAGGSLLDTLPPAQPVEDEPVDGFGAELSETTEVEPAPRLSEALALAEAEPEPETKPEPDEKSEPDKPAPEKPEPSAAQEPALEPVESRPRTGVAAGIARTTVGQAQQEFERPEATFRVERPDQVPVPAPEEPGEPRVAAEEAASTGFTTAPPRPPETTGIPDGRVVEPTLPSVDPSNGALARGGEAPDVVTFEPEIEARSVEELAGEPRLDGPIDAAIQSLVDRLPRKDLYPSPVGEEGEIGFRRAERPSQGVAIAELPEAVVPAVERPSLAGLAPLQAAPEDLSVELAVAEVPEDERPEVADLVMRPESETETVTVRLPEAEAETPAVAEEAPAGDDVDAGPEPAGLVRATPVEEGILVDRLAEAVPGREETAELSDLPSATPGIPPELDAELAEAVPAAEERPEIAVRPSVTPSDEDLVVALAEAGIEAEELPEGSLAVIGPAQEPAISDALAAEAVPEPDDDATEVADELLDRPADIPEDAILALEPADFRPPETPQPDTESILAREEAERDEVADGERLADPGIVDEAPAVVVSPEPEVEPDPEPAPEPETEPAVAVRPEPEPIDRGALPVIGTLEAERYYLQIGAYSEASTAQVAVNALGATYPMAVLPTDRAGRTIYRVLVGPLERDETGTLLLWLRARGYRDTFLREGSEL